MLGIERRSEITESRMKRERVRVRRKLGTLTSIPSVRDNVATRSDSFDKLRANE